VPAILAHRPVGWVNTRFQAAILLADWLSLFFLPRKRRSFGPIEAPLYMLTVFRVLLTCIIGTVGQWSMVSLSFAIVLQLTLLAISVYGLWIEPFRLGVTFQSLQSSRLNPTLPPIRLLHLADIHVERIGIREEYLQQLIAHLAPDVIVFSGDFINLSYRDNPTAYAAVRAVIAQWKAPYGIFTVSGSPLVESPEMVQEFVGGLDIRWLQNESVDLDIRGQHLTIIGVTCRHHIEGDSRDLRHIASNTSSDIFRLLLYHSPDLAPNAGAVGIDLYLCGHTHGGQIRAPIYGAIVTSSAWGKKYEMGRYKIDGTVLYTSRGIGLEGGGAPRARFLCPPEVILWQLTGTSEDLS
jgi:uncharacterized protein